MSGLQTLEVENCGITTADLNTLNIPFQTESILHCSDYKISLAAIEPLKKLRKNGLEDLIVNATGVSENDKSMILRVIPGIRLRVSTNAKPGDYTFLEK